MSVQSLDPVALAGTAIPPRPPTTQRVRLFDVDVDALDATGTLDRVFELVDRPTPSQHVVLNAAKVVQMASDPQLRDIVRSCDLVNADGASIVWASRLLGRPVPERVAGIDLFTAIVERAASSGHGVYFLGATDEVLDEMLARFRRRFPTLRIAGSRQRLLGRRRGGHRRGAPGAARLLVPGDPEPPQGVLVARAPRGSRRAVRDGCRRIVRRRGRQGATRTRSGCSAPAANGSIACARSHGACGSGTSSATPSSWRSPFGSGESFDDGDRHPGGGFGSAAGDRPGNRASGLRVESPQQRRRTLHHGRRGSDPGPNSGARGVRNVRGRDPGAGGPAEHERTRGECRCDPMAGRRPAGGAHRDHVGVGHEFGALRRRVRRRSVDRRLHRRSRVDGGDPRAGHRCPHRRHLVDPRCADDAGVRTTTTSRGRPGRPRPLVRREHRARPLRDTVQ